MNALIVLADSDTGKGSPIGLLVMLVLVVAVYFLYRSMNRHLRNVNRDDAALPGPSRRAGEGARPREDDEQRPEPQA
jgi:hypothetical protein